MRHNASTRRLLSILLAALIVFPNLLIAPAARAASPQQTPIHLNGYIRNQSGDPVPANGKIAFTSHRDGNNGEIYSMNSDGSGVTRLTFNAGVDYNPAWSPDGTKIAFVSSRDADGSQIYLMDADGANVSKLTNTSGVYYRPTWSPDGTRLIFTSRQNSSPSNPQSIYVVDRDGGNLTQISNTEDFFDPVYSPDGTKIAARLEVGVNHMPDIFVMNADGSNPVNITNSPNTRDLDPSWSYDGQRMVFRSQEEFGRYAIFTMNPDGSNKAQLTQFSENHNHAPRWSPDAQKIVFQSERDGNAELYTMNADGSGQTRITDNPAEDLDAAWQQEPSATPAPPAPIPTPTPASAGRIVFVAPVGTTTELFAMNADGSNRVQLTNDPSFENYPAVSPDGSKIAFSANRGYFNIWVMNSDGSNPVELTHDQSYISDPAWSPDGTRIAFPADRGSPGIYVMNADGSNQHKIENGMSGGGKPSWSPDGQKIAFMNSDGTNNNIYVMNADGSNLVKLTNTPSPGSDSEPAWSPDGTKIAFSSIRGGLSFSDIYVMNADGSNQTRITTSFAVADEAPSWSPDGKQITYWTHRDNASQVWRMHANGSYQTRLDSGNMPAWGQAPPPPTPTPSPTPTYTPTPTPTPTSTPQPTPSNTPTPTPTPTPVPGSVGKILFTSIRPGDGGTTIYYMNEDGTGQTRVADLAGAGGATWSPDGTKIAFSASDNSGGSSSEIYVVDANTTNLRRITFSDEQDVKPSWSPDGSKLLFMSYLNGRLDVLTANADGTGLTSLTADTGGGEDPAWSPDGSQIVFRSNRSGSGEIYVMNANGANQTRITFNGTDDYNPQWSPDGAEVAYTGHGGGTAVYLVRPNGQQPRNLTGGGYSSTPIWSPDGSKIAFESFRDDGMNAVYLMNRDGSDQRRLSNEAAGAQFSPVWSPDGARVAFSAYSDGVVSLNVADVAAGGATSMLADLGSDNTPKDWQIVPPIEGAPEPTPTPTPYADLFTYGNADQYIVPSDGQVNYTLSVQNGGAYRAFGIALTGQLPPGVTINSIGSNDGGTCAAAPDNASFNCTFAALSANQAKTVNISATATGAPYARLVTTFTVSGTTYDPNPFNSNSIDFFIPGPPVPTPTPATAANLLIAYQTWRDGNSEIYVQRADGTGRSNLTNSPFDEYNFVWSPDGSRLAFLRTDYTQNANEIYVMNADGSNPTLVSNVGNDYVATIAWSPDGSRLAYSRQNGFGTQSGIHLIDADGSNPLQLSDTSGIDGLPAWSPDGSRLTFTRGFFDVQTGSFAQSIYVINANGSNLVKLDNNAGELDYYPAWSPSGAEIAFIRFPADNAALANLYAVRPDGTGRRNLTNDNTVLYAPVLWSPDGSRLTYVADHSEGAGLNVIKSDGTGRVLVFGGSNSIDNVSWSPDGTKLAFSNPYGEVFLALYTVNADGTGLQHIGGDFEANSLPDWSPDSQRLAFATQRGGGGIDIVKGDGTERVDLTNSPSSYHLPKWQPVARPNTPAGANVSVTTTSGVQLTFSNVTSAGQTTVTPIDPNSLQGIPGEYVINANSLAFEITTTAAYTGPITIGFNVLGITNPITFSTLRVLHGEPPFPNFVDRTILAPDSPAHNFPTRTVYARVSSLSPFVIAERADADTVAPDITVASPVADAVYLLRQIVAASYACADAGSGVASCVGTKASGASLNTSAVGSYSFVVNARDNAGNTRTRTVNYRVAYGVKPLFDQTKANKSGSTIPVKLELTDAANVNQSASNVVVTALAVTRISDNAPGALANPGDANPDYNFRYTGGQYHFNLKTSGYSTGTYLLSFKAGNDPTTHTVQFQVK